MNEYNVMLWPGAGYWLNQFKCEASHEEEALEIIVARLIQDGLSAYYLTTEEYEELFQDELTENPEFESDQYMYIDATMEGAPYPVYLLSENIGIVQC